MASFVHITDARRLGSILRGGLRAERLPRGGRGVHCVPVLPDFQATFGWLRELKRRGYREAVAVQFSLPDAELVSVARFDREPESMTAAQAVAAFMTLPDPRGWEVVVGRKIELRKLHGVRRLRQVTGWRYFPEAKGRPPIWPQPGTPMAARTRARIRAFDAAMERASTGAEPPA